MFGDMTQPSPNLCTTSPPPPAANDLGPIEVWPLSRERWPDQERLFESRGCSMATFCSCLYYRETRVDGQPTGPRDAAGRKAKARQLAETADSPAGLLAYHGGEPVGWVALSPRAAYARLVRSPISKALDTLPVWSVVCFVVPPVYRHQGVAHALLQGAVAYCRARGDVPALEGYPIDPVAQPTQDTFIWPGTLGLFLRAGFVEVARRRPGRPVVRLALA